MARYRLFESDLTLDTAAYADGDVLSDLLTVTTVVRVAGYHAVLKSVVVIDDDDQGIAFDILFFNASVTLAAKNAAWATSDADMAKCQGQIQVVSGDYVDLGGNRIACPSMAGREFVVKPASGTSIYVATRSRGAGTYTAAGIRLILGFEQE